MADLTSVIVGALIAAGSGGGVQWYMHKLKVEDELRRIRTSKLELIIIGLFEHQTWLKARGDHLLFDEANPEKNPFPSIRALAALYFPSHLNSFLELDIYADKVELWCMGARQRKPASGQYSDAQSEERLELYVAYTQKLYDLVGSLEEQAASEFRATSGDSIQRMVRALRGYAEGDKKE